jgi:hypothetical protein
LVRAFHTYPDDDVNDDEGLRPLKPRGIAFPAILFARAPLKTDDDAFGVFVEVKIVLLLKVVLGDDDVFCDVFRIIIIASAAWVRAAPVVANNTPRRLLIPQEDILLFSRACSCLPPTSSVPKVLCLFLLSALSDSVCCCFSFIFYNF